MTIISGEKMAKTSWRKRNNQYVAAKRRNINSMRRNGNGGSISEMAINHQQAAYHERKRATWQHINIINVAYQRLLGIIKLMASPARHGSSKAQRNGISRVRSYLFV